MPSKIMSVTAEIMEAYFKGGNAKDKSSQNIKEDLKVIKEIVEGEEKE